MSDLRLVWNVFVPTEGDFPADDDHPFWLAIDAIGDAVADAARARGVDPDEMEAMQESDEGSPLVQSSDAPHWALRCWVYLPRDPAAQATLLPIVLEHLAEAREELPDAEWDVKLGERPLVWDGGRFHLTS